MRSSGRAFRPVLFNTDCEGPTVANDHALEVAARWLPDGRRLFQQLSRFDDFVAYVSERSFYNAGDTLRLILPFLKAYGQLTDEKLTVWTSKEQKIQWIEGAQQAIKHLLDDGLEVFEISASYYPFAARVAEGLGIKQDHVYSTYFSLDHYNMTSSEASRLKKLATEIVMLPDVPETDVTDPIRRFEELPASDKGVLSRLEEIVWVEMAKELPCSSRMLCEIRAMGGREKVAAILDTLERTQLPPEDTIYVGDSITDVEAFRLLRDMAGVSISFNGNQHAVGEATFCSWGNTSLVAVLITGIFRHHGRDGLSRFAASRGQDVGIVPADLVGIHNALGSEWGIASFSSEENRAEILKKSLQYRYQTREAAAAASS